MVVFKWAGRLLLLILGLVLLLALYIRFFMPGVNFDATGTKLMLNSIFGGTGDAVSEEQVEKGLSVAEGFNVSLFAKGFSNARFLRVTSAGDVLVSNPRSNQVILVKAGDNGQSSGQQILLDDLNKPHGLDIHDGFLYIGEIDAVGRVAFDQVTGALTGQYQRIVTGLTGNGNHWTKTVKVGADGWLYVAMGSTCNVCVETDERRATMMRYKLDGSEGEIYAKGLRNSVGFDWAPWDGALYATDNGRDMLGDDFPPCELNRIEQGGHYGWPYVNADKVKDPDFGDVTGAVVEASIVPSFNFKPHNAPLGMTFLDASTLPDEYQRSALVALHGSWNRSQRDGYKVVKLSWDSQGVISSTDFLTGFLTKDDVIGRPVDVAQGPNGEIFVSDDFSGTIYRIEYVGEGASTKMAAVSAAEVKTVDPLAGLSEQTLSAANEVGSKIYQQFNCAMCHEAKGGNFIKALDLVHEKYSLAELTAFFAAPTPPMPRFPLTDLQREQVATYLLAKSSKR